MAQSENKRVVAATKASAAAQAITRTFDPAMPAETVAYELRIAAQFLTEAQAALQAVQSGAD